MTKASTGMLEKGTPTPSPSPPGKVVARKRASNDADVSTTSPIMPYGGFSPVRLEGWPVR
jgi:hypothetical protein